MGGSRQRIHIGELEQEANGLGRDKGRAEGPSWGGEGANRGQGGIWVRVPPGITTVTVFSFFSFFFFFLNHMFIVSTVQEMTCIFNDMAKTKPENKITINKRNNHNHFPQRDQ